MPLKMRIRLDQPKRQLLAAALVAFYKIQNRRWNVAHLKIAAAAYFERYIFRNIFRPRLGSVESDNPYRVVILA